MLPHIALQIVLVYMVMYFTFAKYTKYIAGAWPAEDSKTVWSGDWANNYQ